MQSIRIAVFGLGICLAWGAGAEAQQPPEPVIPLTNSPSSEYMGQPLTYAQQIARFESDQRVLRLQWNQWIGYDPLRPTMNASYMSNGRQKYYIPSRSVIVSVGNSRAWYW